MKEKNDMKIDEPQSENEWMIHALNIHGTFFEDWCEYILSQSNHWELVDTKYPVEFPPTTGSKKAGQSELDVRGNLKIYDTVVESLIECKKNNPEFSNWIFFKKREQSPPFFRYLYSEKDNPINRIQHHLTVKKIDLIQLPITDDAREVRGDYQGNKKGDKTKTANNSIWDSAYQVTLAMQAIILEEARNFLNRPLGDMKKLFLPIILTTANLMLATYDRQIVNPLNGEISWNNVEFEARDYLIYEYSIPTHLQYNPYVLSQIGGIIRPSFNDSIRQSEQIVRSPILIVQSGKFQEFLESIYESVKFSL